MLHYKEIIKANVIRRYCFSFCFHTGQTQIQSIHPLTPQLSVQNVVAAHLIVFEIFQSGTKWWTDWQTDIAACVTKTVSYYNYVLLTAQQQSCFLSVLLVVCCMCGRGHCNPVLSRACSKLRLKSLDFHLEWNVIGFTIKLILNQDWFWLVLCCCALCKYKSH